MKLADLALRLGATVRGNGAIDVVRVRGIEEAGTGGPHLRLQSPLPRQARDHPRLRGDRGPRGGVHPARAPHREPLPRLRARGGDPARGAPAPAGVHAERPGGPHRRPGRRRARGGPGGRGAAGAPGRAHRRPSPRDPLRRRERWARTACSTPGCRCARAAASATGSSSTTAPSSGPTASGSRRTRRGATRRSRRWGSW